MATLITVCRLVLVAVFGAAAAAKLADRGGATAAAEALGLPPPLARTSGVLLPMAELAAMALLVVGPTTRVGAVVGLLLLVSFTVLVAVNLSRGSRPQCHCFGQLGDSPIGPATVARNIALMVPAAIVLVGPDRRLPLHSALGTELARWGLVPAAGLLGLAVLVQTAVIVALLLRQHDLQGHVTTLERDDAGSGLRVGSSAPPFSLPDLDGAEVSLEQLRAAGHPMLLVFTDPTCKPCNALLPEVADWQASYADVLTVAVLSTGAVDMNRDKVIAHGLTTVLLQDGMEVATAYRFAGTPGAVLVGTNGRIAAPLATGAAAIRQLAGTVIQDARTVAAPPPARLEVGDAAPALHLPGLNGTLVDLFDLSGRLIVLIFLDPTSPHCRALLPGLLSREAALEEADVRLLMVCSGGALAARTLGFQSTVVLDDDLLTSRAFGVAATPMALLVDAQVRVTSPPATGAEDVLLLLNRALRLGQATKTLARQLKPASSPSAGSRARDGDMDEAGKLNSSHRGEKHFGKRSGGRSEAGQIVMVDNDGVTDHGSPGAGRATSDEYDR